MVINRICSLLLTAILLLPSTGKAEETNNETTAMLKFFLSLNPEMIYHHINMIDYEACVSWIANSKIATTELMSHSDIVKGYQFFQIDSIVGSERSIAFNDSIKYVVAVCKLTGVGFRLQGFDQDDTISFLCDIQKRYTHMSLMQIAQLCQFEQLDVLCRFQLLTDKKYLGTSHCKNRYQTCLRRLTDGIFIETKNCF